MAVDDAVTTLGERLGRSPTVGQIAERLELTQEDVVEALSAHHARRTRSLDAPVSSEDGESLTIVEGLGRDEPGYDRVEAQAASESADINEVEFEVLRLRFEEDLTQSEIGRRIGVSQMQVSRLLRRALAKLLKAVQGNEPTPA